MTVFMTQGFASEANVANIGIFFTNDAGELQCAGSPLSMPVSRSTISDYSLGF